jgi:hypothetical protein
MLDLRSCRTTLGTVLSRLAQGRRKLVGDENRGNEKCPVPTDLGVTNTEDRRVGSTGQFKTSSKA